MEGHDTEDCDMLAKELDKLAAHGKLDKFLHKLMDQSPDNRREGEIAPRGVINMIAGGSSVDRTTKRKRTYKDRERLAEIAKIFYFGQLKNRPTKPHDDAIVIEMRIERYIVRRVLLNTGSSANIITRKAYEALGLYSNRFKATNAPLIGISGNHVPLLGETRLQVKIGNATLRWKIEVNFLVFDTNLAYNVIIGRPLISGSRGAVSMWYLALMIPTLKGRVVALGRKTAARHTYITSLGIFPQMNDILEHERERTESVDPIEKIWLTEGKPVKMASEMKEEPKEDRISTLKANIDAFDWKPSYIIGVSRDVMEHTLDVDPEAKPVKQKKRNQ